MNEKLEKMTKEELKEFAKQKWIECDRISNEVWLNQDNLEKALTALRLLTIGFDIEEFDVHKAVDALKGLDTSEKAQQSWEFASEFNTYQKLVRIASDYCHEALQIEKKIAE